MPRRARGALLLDGRTAEARAFRRGRLRGRRMLGCGIARLAVDTARGDGPHRLAVLVEKGNGAEPRLDQAITGANVVAPLPSTSS